MQAISAQQVYSEIIAHIRSQGGPISNWYAGIASDWEERLFSDHNVPRQNSWYIARQCHSEQDARAVEEKLLNDGCDGGSGGGDSSSVYVYAYLKTSQTNP